MFKLIIGNKNYSSWSLRGWLACKQSGLPFEEVVVPLYDETWNERRKADDLAPSSGKVPILWDGDIPIWDSLAIIEHLNEKSGGDKFWPAEEGARAMARSMAAEMHAGCTSLRSAHSMNIRKIFPAQPPSPAVLADIERIMEIWAQARARFGGSGDFLLGDFGATDIMYAPVVTRLITYALPVAPFAEPYLEAIIAHPWMQDWIASAQAEQEVIERFEGTTVP
ncbi:MAG: glutathione S-transferase family protein [Sphingomonadaceae bacterium]